MNTWTDDKLDMLICLAARECGNDDVEAFDNTDTGDTKLSKGFYARAKRTVSRYRHRTMLKTLHRVSVRIAVALMALMSLCVITVVAIPNLRDAMVGAVVEWYNDCVSVKFDLDGLEIPDAPTNHNSDAPVMSNVKKPTRLPDGATERVVVNNKWRFGVDYYSGDKLLCSYEQCPFTDSKTYFDNTGIKISSIDIHGCTASLIEYSGHNAKTIIWTDGQYIYRIMSYELSRGELIDIAESIFEGAQ